jgi:glycerol-3-phosphate O-acyltransferase
MVQKKNPNFDPFTNEEDKKAVDIALAHQIVYDINQASVWAPMAVVSAILLTYRLGIFRTQLVEKVDWLRQEIMRRQEGHEDWMAELSAAELTKQALARLENYVEDRKDMISSQEKTGVLVLAFNRNRLIHLFVRDSFIMVALAALGGDQPESKGVLLSELYKGAHFLVKLLGKEFVYKVHPNDDEVRLALLGSLILLFFQFIRSEKSLIRTKTISKGLERVVQDAIEQKVLELDSTNGADTIRLVQSETARSAFHFYAGLMWPFVECYWVASLVLYSLKPSATQMQPLVQRMQWMAEALISEGKMSFYESCSVETLKNAIHSLAKFGVMRFDNFGQVVGVNKSFLEDGAGSLRAFVADLGRYRRKVDDDVPTDIGVPRALLEDFPIRAKL